ncbi:hypothetical protein ACFX2I_001958 [Malus domestica]
MLNLSVKYPWEVHESVHTVEDFHSEYSTDQKAYMFEDDCSYKDQMHFYQNFPVLEPNEITLPTFMGLSVGGELSSVYENIEPQQWDKKDKLNGEELLGTKEYGIPEYLLDLRSDLGSLDIIPEMDLLSMVEMPLIQGDITYQGASTVASFQSLSPVVFEVSQILDLDSSHHFEVLICTQTANEPETCDWMFSGDINFNTLIVSHELALVDDTFKSLPVPVLSDHEKICSSYVVMEETLTYRCCPYLHQIGFTWIGIFSRKMIVYDFAFSDDAVEEFNTEENKELQELPSDGIPMVAGHLGDTSAELSGSTFPRKKNGEQIDKRVVNMNDQQSEELLDIFPGHEKNDMRYKEGADEAEASNMPLPNLSMPSAMEAERFQHSMASFPEMVIVVNTQNLDKEVIVSRSTYKKNSCNGERRVWYDCKNIGQKATTLDEASSYLPLCIENIATNVLTFAEFHFQWLLYGS